MSCRNYRVRETPGLYSTQHTAGSSSLASCLLLFCSIPQVLLDTVLHPPEDGPALYLYTSGLNTLFLFVAVSVAYGMVSGNTEHLSLRVAHDCSRGWLTGWLYVPHPTLITYLIQSS